MQSSIVSLLSGVIVPDEAKSPGLVDDVFKEILATAEGASETLAPAQPTPQTMAGSNPPVFLLSSANPVVALEMPTTAPGMTADFPAVADETLMDQLPTEPNATQYNTDRKDTLIPVEKIESPIIALEDVPPIRVLPKQQPPVVIRDKIILEPAITDDTATIQPEVKDKELIEPSQVVQAPTVVDATQFRLSESKPPASPDASPQRLEVEPSATEEIVAIPPVLLQATLSSAQHPENHTVDVKVKDILPEQKDIFLTGVPERASLGLPPILPERKSADALPKSGIESSRPSLFMDKTAAHPRAPEILPVQANSNAVANFDIFNRDAQAKPDHAREISVTSAATGENLHGVSEARLPERLDAQAEILRSSRPVSMDHLPRQFLVHVKTALKEGASHFTLQLDPPNLGKVEVRMDMAADGKTGMVVTADNKDALDLLQRDARGLEKTLQDLGLKTDAGSLSFNLRGGQGESQQQADNKNTAFTPASVDEPMEDRIMQAGEYTLTLTNGVDIKV